MKNSERGINPWPIAIPAFLVFIICFNTWFGITASKGTLPNVESGTYEKGLQYQLVIDKINKSKELKWKINFIPSYSSKEINLEVFSPEGQKISFDNATAQFVKPENALLDKKISFQGSTAKFDSIVSGLWLYEVEVKALGKEFYEKGRIVLP